MATTTNVPVPSLEANKALELALNVNGSRQQFAAAFRAAQSPSPDPLEFEAVTSTIGDRVAALARGFVRAAEGGWLAALCDALLNARIVTGAFTEAAAGATPDDAHLAQLQQITDPHTGIVDAGLFVKRFPTAIRQVCQIELDGDPKGTGFLIRADLVMTAYHVVRPLLDGQDKPLAGSASKLRVRFDYKRVIGGDGAVDIFAGSPCKVADPWLVALSPCTSAELLKKLPANHDDLNDHWDFAVIRLGQVPPGTARAGLEIVDLPVTVGHRMLILQHPKAKPLGWDSSTVVGFLGNGGFRIVHDVNTEDGSSGSPCLNDQFRVVGLHQAAMPTVANAKKTNRAIPMPRILTAWGLAAAPPPGAVFRPLLRISTADRTDHPVFGRAKLQQWLSRSSRSDVPGPPRDRFLVVSGPKGSGKTFTIDVFKAVLTQSEHLLIECRASDFNKETTALGFAEKYLLAPLGTNATGLPALSQADTSDNAWLNYQLVGDLLNVMDQNRQDRMVWLVLDELDEVVLPDQGQVRKLLDLMYARAGTTPWLRFVLLGLDAVPVSSAATLTERDVAGSTSAAALTNDVLDYLMSRLEEAGKASDVPTRAGLAPFVGTIINLCVDLCDKRIDHPKLLAMVVGKIASLEPTGGGE